jgi:hypothetical protein
MSCICQIKYKDFICPLFSLDATRITIKSIAYIYTMPTRSNGFLWGFIAGLLLGAGAGGHALRLVVLGMDTLTTRHYVAGFAVILYLVAGLLVCLRRKAGLYIAILGPLGGITAVTLSPQAQIDTFQVVLGIPQFLAIGLSVWLLIKEGNRQK